MLLDKFRFRYFCQRGRQLLCAVLVVVGLVTRVDAQDTTIAPREQRLTDLIGRWKEIPGGKETGRIEWSDESTGQSVALTRWSDAIGRAAWSHTVIWGPAPIVKPPAKQRDTTAQPPIRGVRSVQWNAQGQVVEIRDLSLDSGCIRWLRRDGGDTVRVFIGSDGGRGHRLSWRQVSWVADSFAPLWGIDEPIALWWAVRQSLPLQSPKWVLALPPCDITTVGNLQQWWAPVPGWIGGLQRMTSQAAMDGIWLARLSLPPQGWSLGGRRLIASAIRRDSAPPSKENSEIP